MGGKRWREWREEETRIASEDGVRERGERYGEKEDG